MKKTLLLSAITSLLASSCSTVYYSPNTHNVPLFEEKGEVRVAAHSGSADDIKTIDLQGAYAVTNRFAVMAAFFSANGNNNNNAGNNKLWGNGSLFEAGGGIYYPFGSMFVFETYGVFGTGNSVVRYSDTVNDQLQNRFNKIYIQPSIGITTRYFDIAFSNRIAWLNMYDVSGGNSYSTFMTDKRSIEAARNSLLYEYGITVRGGWKYIKLQLQTNFSTFLSAKSFPANRQSTSLGLVFSLGSDAKRGFNPTNQ